MTDHINLFESIRSKVNNALESFYLPENPKSLYDPMRYVIKGKGKRLRPILLHLTGRAFRVEHKSLMDASIAVELLHNFTLVHDDIMDDDNIRHGKSSVHKKWDEATAILVGDALFSYAQISMIKFSDNTKTHQTFNNTMIEICEGQALDIHFENDDSISENQYLDMVEKKSGALLGFCSKIVAEDIQLDQSICIAMDNFGRNLGKGFQIQDDILEIFSDTKNMGKSLGSDIISGKQTILTILARDKYPKRWYEILNLFITEKKGLNKIRNFLKESGVKDIAENMASVFFKEAMLCLEKIENVNKLELQNFIDFIKIRGR
ncbi:MAG: hypothetical protein CMG04_08190 [Candidatus Marinimicrobia bacterium]|nr:hypothetical protein [Candidatus Neomarinimicrobiota bacterium]|tara:strand:- start:950 stop:1909 length:960 start_codon:yes stop_codon:yes gene_type:complete